MAKLKVGIVGCGTIFHYHYAFIRSNEGATFCGVADRDGKALGKIREIYGIEHCYTDLEDMIRKDRDLEKIVLARAIYAHLQHQILVYDNRTVVFD